MGVGGKSLQQRLAVPLVRGQDRLRPWAWRASFDGPQVMQIVRRAEREGELSWGENPGSRRVPLVSSLASLGSYKRIVAA